MNRIIANRTILLNTATNCTFIANKLDEDTQTGTGENDKHIEWTGQLDISIISNFENLLNELYEEIKHGDEEHQQWLKDKIQEFISKQLNNK